MGREGTFAWWVGLEARGLGDRGGEELGWMAHLQILRDVLWRIPDGGSPVGPVVRVVW